MIGALGCIRSATRPSGAALIRDPLEILEDEQSPDEHRALAASLLRGRTDARAMEAFTKALDGPGPAVRRAAAWALSESAANLARAASEAVLSDPRIPRSEGLAILGYLLQAGLPTLQRALIDGGSADERCQAAAIMLCVPYERALRMLEEALDDDGRLGVLAASLLVRRSDDAVRRLLVTLDDPQAPVDLRGIAAHSLIDVADENIARNVATALSDADLVVAWSDHSPTETARLIDRAIASEWAVLRQAGENAYRLTVSRIEEPARDRIAEWVARLTDNDHDVRSNASDHLLGLAAAEDVLTPLRHVVERHFDDPDVVLAEVADVLGKLADPAAIDALITLAEHRDWMTRLFAIEGLSRLPDPAAAQTVYRALGNDPRQHVRKAAVLAVPAVHRPDDEACDVLVACVLRDNTVVGTNPNDRVVRPAGRMLGVLKLNEAVGPLQHGLGDPRAAVRQSAAWALGELEAVVALDALAGLLEDDPSAPVRAAAAWAIGQLGQPTAISGLSVGLNDPDARVRDNAALALGELQDRSAAPALISALDQESEELVRDRLAWALGKLQDSGALDVLHRLLMRDRSATIRERCARSLGEIGAQRSGPVLVDRLVVEADPGVREAIVHALGELAWQDVRADLEVRVSDDLSFGVRKAAAQVLGRIGDDGSARILEQIAADSQHPQEIREAARRAVERIRRRMDGTEALAD